MCIRVLLNTTQVKTSLTKEDDINKHRQVKCLRKRKEKTEGGVSYRVYAQTLNQTTLGTECSLSHFLKTSYLPWQQ